MKKEIISKNLPSLQDKKTMLEKDMHLKAFDELNFGKNDEFMRYIVDNIKNYNNWSYTLFGLLFLGVNFTLKDSNGQIINNVPLFSSLLDFTDIVNNKSYVDNIRIFQESSLILESIKEDPSHESFLIYRAITTKIYDLYYKELDNEERDITDDLQGIRFIEFYAYSLAFEHLLPSGNNEFLSRQWENLILVADAIKSVNNDDSY